MTQGVIRYTSFPFPATRNRKVQTGDTVIVPPHSDIHACIKLLPAATLPSTANSRHEPHYLYGVDLFNDGYWWEAHVPWECLWNSAGRNCEVGRFLQQLILCTGALFKNTKGLDRAARAMGRKALITLGTYPDTYMGVQVKHLTNEFVRYLESAGSRPVIELISH